MRQTTRTSKSPIHTTFCEPDFRLKELIHEQVVPFNINGDISKALSPVFAKLEENKTYNIFFDGIRYECVCKKYDKYLYIGNSFLENVPSILPFAYVTIPEEPKSRKSYIWYSFNNKSSTHVILLELIEFNSDTI